MTDHLADIKKYDSHADEDVVKRLVNRLSLVLQNRDTAMVATTDQEELARVEKNWAQDKLGADSETSKRAVHKVADEMKGEHMKNRVTFYYLVAKELGALNKI